MNRKIPWLPVAALVALAIAIPMMLLYAPREALQGNVQRLFYVHVPSAWVTYLAISITTLASVLVLWRRQEAQRWDAIAASSAEIGVIFTTIVLITGPIWGRKIWGTWWVWDARLTSTLVLWAVYVGYLAFRWLTPPSDKRARASAVIGIVGAIDIPVIHFSVVWWRTLHPLPTVLRSGGPDLPSKMLVTLMVSLAAFTIVFAALLVSRIRRAQARISERESEAVDA